MASAKSTSRSKNPKKPKKPPKDLRFDFIGSVEIDFKAVEIDFKAGKPSNPGKPFTPGPMVALSNEAKHQVRCTEWPQSLLDMLEAGVLRGRAYEKACALKGRKEGQVSS